MTSPAPRLLIVDDEQDFAISTSRALALEGVDCILAHSADEALRLLETTDCQIALLDIRIREEDGTELAAHLQAQYPGIITIIMTGYASVDSAIAAMQAGAHDFLRKPFFLDELMRALHRAFEILRLRDEKAAAERELSLLRQLEATSQLAAGLSHDFRNMLTVVQANLGVLIDRLADRPALLSYATDARNAAGAATSVVTRLTDFIRQTGVAPLPLDLRAPVQAAVDMMRSTLAAEMQLSLSLPDAPLMVLAEAAMIETAMVNLLINARDATGGKGHVTIRLSRLTQGADYARLVVQDDGPGLSGDVAEHVLEPFFTTKRDGLGLGLPMIRQFAQGNGGAFRLINGPEGGARAILDLPALPLQPDGANI